MNNKIEVTLDKIKKFLAENSGSGITIDATGDADVLKALKENTPLPNKEIELGKLTVGTNDGKNIEFNTDTGRVSFNGKAGASQYAGLGLYQNPDALISSFGLGTDKIAPAISPENGEKSHFLVFRWGYDLAGEGNGSIALANPVKVQFGSDAKREGLFAIVKRISDSTGARSAVADTVNSWRIPSLVDGIDDLEPGTWLITEVESRLNVKLGAQYGYDFDWVKAAKAGGLSGDIGLRLQLGVDVAVGMHLSGKFALVLARESGDPSDKKLRLQLFKLRKKGWNFALDSGASVDPDFDKFLPEKFDPFVKAVFGTHGEQVLRDLEMIEKWTDPDEELPDLLYGAGSAYAGELLQKITGLDLENSFEAAKQKLQNLFVKWNELDHKVAMHLWEVIEGKSDQLGNIKETVEKLTEADEEAVKGYIENILSDVDFFHTTAGKMLLNLIPGESLLETLTDSRAFDKLQKNAEKVTQILDGGAVQALFEKLHREISERLSLDQLKEITIEADLEDLDELLKAKLKNFIGDDNLTLSKIEEIRKTIHLLIDKREEFYSKTISALNRKYEFSLNAAYQKTTSDQALLDITFDFNLADVSDLLKNALRGNFDEILIEKKDGIHLHTATLTHEIERQSSIEISLPFYESTVTHINKSLAKAEFIDEDDGRLMVYELGARDIITRKNSRISALSIGGYFEAGNNRVRVHNKRSLSYSYSFRQYEQNMKRADLEYQLTPYVETYFDSLFNDPDSEVTSEPFSTWLGDVDETIDRIEPNGKDNFGHAFVSLEVTLPGEISSAWLKAPADKKDIRYMNMSCNIQSALRELIPFYYFQNAENYKDITPSRVLLAYASLPASTSVRTRSGRVTELDTNKEIYWDWPDENLQAAMLTHPETISELKRNLFKVHYRLNSIPGMSKTAKHYHHQNLRSILLDLSAGIKKSRGPVNMLFYHLLYTENAIIDGAYNAAQNLVKFLESADKKPSEAVRELTQFGAEITETFNKHIKTDFGGDALRPLGTLIFTEAARAFDQNIVDSGIRAMLDLIVLKKSDTNRYLDKKEIPKENILLEERFIS
jgi:hypothetical protein